jgi:hypothetical protein
MSLPPDPAACAACTSRRLPCACSAISCKRSPTSVLMILSPIGDNVVCSGMKEIAPRRSLPTTGGGVSPPRRLRVRILYWSAQSAGQPASRPSLLRQPPRVVRQGCARLSPFCVSSRARVPFCAPPPFAPPPRFPFALPPPFASLPRPFAPPLDPLPRAGVRLLFNQPLAHPNEAEAHKGPAAKVAPSEVSPGTAKGMPPCS